MASGNLEVLLVDAKSLRHTDFFGKMDPYVLIQYGNEKHKSSVAQGQGRNPVWNETFIFDAEYPGKVEDEYKLTLKIMDHDRFSTDDFVGESTIYVKDVLSLGMEQGKAELIPRLYRVVLEDKTYRGEIQVGVTFTRKEVEVEDENVEDEGGWKQSSFY